MSEEGQTDNHGATSRSRLLFHELELLFARISWTWFAISCGWLVFSWLFGFWLNIVYAAVSSTFSSLYLTYLVRRKHLPEVLSPVLVACFSAAAIYGFAGSYQEAGLLVEGRTSHSFGDALYFSIVTWTTLGYGDICPTPDVRMRAASEAAMGYVAMGLLTATLLFQSAIFGKTLPSMLDLLSTKNLALIFHPVILLLFLLMVVLFIIILSLLFLNLYVLSIAFSAALAMVAIVLWGGKELPTDNLTIPVMLFSMGSSVYAFARLFQSKGLVVGAIVSHEFNDALYFSIVTWTTLGYGDMCPTPEARMLAASEAAMGYVLMSAGIALIVNCFLNLRETIRTLGGSDFLDRFEVRTPSNKSKSV